MSNLGRIACCVFVVAAATACHATVITAIPTELEEDRWQYDYAVENDTFPGPIMEFRLSFDKSLYDGLAIETLDPLASDWDEIVMPYDPILDDDALYDALTLSGGIPPEDTHSGFAVSFDWLGEGVPGAQPYEIMNATTLGIIETGETVVVPEPATLSILAMGAVGLLVRRRRS